MKVVITGGHLTPALAVIDELLERKVELTFIGRTHSMEGDSTPSVESQTIKSLGIDFYPLTTGRLQRRFTRYTIPSLIKIPYGLSQAYYLLNKLRPDVVLSFGGYLAVPVVISAKLLGIPVVTHEQTVTFGLANKIISSFADKIAVSWEQSLSHFPKNKVVLTGNPIRKELLGIKRKTGSKPVLYFTGGNQGAHIINQALFEIIQELVEMFEVYHQTGTGFNSQDYEKAQFIASGLARNVAKNYIYKPWFVTNELKNILSKATLVISRAGANTIAELATLGIPSILIPIPWVSQDEQTKNASILAEANMAVILREKELTPKKLFTTIQLCMENINDFEKNARNYRKNFKNNAAEKIADLVFSTSKDKTSEPV